MTTASKLNGKRRGSNGVRRASAPQAPVLVCGGAGFIGSHLCARLMREGKQVICLDNFCTSDEEAVERWDGRGDFTLVRGDVADLEPDQFESVSEIYNLACAASPVHYQKSPLATLFASVYGMERLLRLAHRCRARIFQASTSEIYGHPTIHPQTERYWGHVNTMGPRACYDEGKRCAETLCYIYHDRFGVKVRVGRIFNTYGPGMRMSDGRVVINFIVQALANEPLTVYGDGRQTRSFCYVDDSVEAIMRMMASGTDCLGPINIGNPLEISVLELAQRVLHLTDSKSCIRIQPLPMDDPPRRKPDISRAMQLLDWRPQTDLETGLLRTIDDVQRRLAQDVSDASIALSERRARAAGGRFGIAGSSL